MSITKGQIHAALVEGGPYKATIISHKRWVGGVLVEHWTRRAVDGLIVWHVGKPA